MRRSPVPTPVVTLLVAAVAVAAIGPLHSPPVHVVEWILTVALVCILFDGGMHIGTARLRPVLGPVLCVGLIATVLTTAAGAVLLHAAFGLSWYAAVLVGTAVAPTDPAVVFSVLGKREIVGHSGTVLEGESGANDPVGIALMKCVISAGAISWHAAGSIGAEFALQLGVGLAVGVVGAVVAVRVVPRLRMPGRVVFLLCALAAAAAIYALATVCRGSGYLAVFVAAIALGDRAGQHREIRRLQARLSSLAEVVAFVVLGLTVQLSTLAHRDVWLPGLVLALVLAVVARPIAVALCLAPSGLARNEIGFVAFAGLKGAVPLLLGQLMLAGSVPHAARLYGIVVVVVIFSVLVQGTSTPLVARVLRIPMREGG